MNALAGGIRLPDVPLVGAAADQLFEEILAVYGAACGGGDKSPSTPTPSSNRAPVIGALTVSPQGMGIQSATIFTFLGQNVSDPDGDALTYSWVSSDGASIASNTQADSHVYAGSGTFVMRLTVTDPAGLSASASVSVTVGTVTGVWDVSCVRTAYALQNCAPAFPTQFVVTLTQSGSSLFGSVTGGGKTRSFTVPGNVSNPRVSSFGVESRDNVFCGPNWDEDFWFHLAANDTLTSMSSLDSYRYCASSIATKR